MDSKTNFHAEAKKPGDEGGERLEKELCARPEAAAVVQNTQRQEDGERRQQLQHFLRCRVAALGGKTEEDCGDRDKGDKHSQAATARNRFGVDMTLEIRLVNHPPFGQQPNQKACQHH